MRDKYVAFLESINMIPVEKHWNSFSIIHTPPENLEEQKRVEGSIKEKVGKTNGLYMYSTPEGKCLYIGKGKPVAGRLISHYRESFGTVPGDTKDQRWHRFFSSHQGELVIHWVAIAEEADRRITELLLEYVHGPAFSSFR